MQLSPEIRKRFALAGLAVVLLALAFSAGRFSAPEQVRTVEQWRTLDLKVEDITRGFATTRVVERVVYRNVRTEITDAGTVITDNSIERVGSSSSTTSTESTKRASAEEKQSVTERVVTVRPDWRVSGQVGAALVAPALPITGNLVLGASVERRLVGGVSAGLWANTVGAGGVVISGEF